MAPLCARSAVAALGVFAVAIAPAVSLAHDYALANLRIEHPYARPTPPGAGIGGAYFTIRNVGNGADRLLRVSSPAAQTVELHAMTMDGNLMKMRVIRALDIPAGSSVTLRTGGSHVMLTGLRQRLAIGDRVPLTLIFQKAGTLEVFADVEAPNAAADMAASAVRRH